MKNYSIETEPRSLTEDGMEFFPLDIKPLTFGTRAHIHEAIEIIFVERGEYRMFAGDNEYSVRSGDMMLFRSNTIHSIFACDSEENRYYVLKVKPSLIFDLASKDSAVGYVMRFVLSGEASKTHWSAQELSQSEIYLSFERMRKTLESMDFCLDLALKLSAAEVILAILRDIIAREQQSGITSYLNDSAAGQIYKAIRQINRRYSESITAQSCAEDVNMSYSYFSRSFKRITQKSFKEYLNEIRVSNAERLLMSTDLSVTEIALECGYNNVSYFIMVYKSIKGKTPFSYRNGKM
ncbi:MAG: helix-turn-helix transcriptional regulator [Clostridia bacterium]|nr:helix-turn-helix transcriptional regulator [Clostridia bacterium]